MEQGMVNHFGQGFEADTFSQTYPLHNVDSPCVNT
jgi:hypothetical protein